MNLTDDSEFPGGVHGVSTVSSASNMWHCQMGHLSSKNLQVLANKTFEINHFDLYDSCHLAKHTRFSFPVSIAKSTRCFEWLHVDI